MTQRIELQAGPDRQYRTICGWIWVCSAAVFVAKFPAMHWVLSFVCCLVLWVLRPGSANWLMETTQLILYTDGKALLGDGNTRMDGRWRAPARFSRWLTVVAIDTIAGTKRLAICASLNHPDDYRHLQVWSRLPPFEKTPSSQRRYGP